MYSSKKVFGRACKCVLTCMYLFLPSWVFSQKSFLSEGLIIYDLKTHKTDKPIPFDRAFTLLVTKIPLKKVEDVDAYENYMDDGQRQSMIDGYNEEGDIISNKDVTLSFQQRKDSLYIYFPPMKPGRLFDLSVSGLLQENARLPLMATNYQLSLQTSDGRAKAALEYEKFVNIVNVSEFDIFPDYMSFEEYADLYDPDIHNHYKAPTDLLNAASYSTTGGLVQSDIKAIDMESIDDLSNFRDAPAFWEITGRNGWKEIELGIIDIRKVFDLKAKPAEMWELSARIANLNSNLRVLDSLHVRLDRILSKGVPTFPARATDIDSARSAVKRSMGAVKDNAKRVDGALTDINKVYDGNLRFRQTLNLVGTTVSSDLKSASGNLLFLDLGLANIFAHNLDGSWAFLPKAYYGVSIYFRPIDKNTRRSSFPRSFEDRDRENGPDYNIVTKRHILQHLALNVGFTVGSMSGDFANFYNNTSLLIGPSYRFARAFKVSAGGALLRQSSKNPLESEKHVIGGYYVSLSVDVDVVQGLKDVTSFLMK
jgi:hypothetical protein